MKKVVHLTLALLAASVFSACSGKSEPAAPPPASEASAPANPVPAALPAAAPSAPAPAPAELSAQLNGKSWKASGFFHSHLFYSKGIARMNEGKPFLMLAFKSANAPDNRQVNFQVIEFKEQVGLVDAQSLEISLSGAEDGQSTSSAMQGNGTKDSRTPFSFEVTEWKRLSPDEAVISGKFSGTLKGFFGSPDASFQDGSFSNVKVKVFNDKY